MADRYWRGGAGTWNSVNTTNWSATSGGLGGASVPTSADNVYFDSASNATNYTVTTTAGVIDMLCLNLNITGPLAGSVTFSNTNSNLNIFGSLVHAASGVIWGGSVTLVFQSPTTGNTITTNGFSFSNAHTYSGSGGEWTLLGNVTLSSARTLTLSRGTLNLNNFTYTSGFFSSNVATARTLAFGTGKIDISGSNTAIWNASGNNLTVSGSRRVEFSYTGAVGTRNIGLLTNGTEANSLDFYVLGGTDIVTLTGNPKAARTLNFTGFAGTYTNATAVTIIMYGDLIFNAGMVISATNVGFTFAVTSGTQAITTAGQTLDLPLIFNGIGGTFAFQDALTQGATKAFTITNGTVQLKHSETSTTGVFATIGANQKFLQSTLAGTQATLTQAAGTVDASNLTIKDINATGGATWLAYINQQNIDAGNNNGWDFNISPVAGGTEYTYSIRSFTQPRRF